MFCLVGFRINSLEILEGHKESIAGVLGFDTFLAGLGRFSVGVLAIACVDDGNVLTVGFMTVGL